MRDGTTRAVLGIARNQQAGPMLAEASRHLALAWFEKGGEPPLLLKSNLISTVHRAVPLDLAVVPIIENGKIAGLRSEEHTSELQSLMRISYAVFCLKKKKNKEDIECKKQTHTSNNHVIKTSVVV